MADVSRPGSPTSFRIKQLIKISCSASLIEKLISQNILAAVGFFTAAINQRTAQYQSCSATCQTRRHIGSFDTFILPQNIVPSHASHTFEFVRSTCLPSLSSRTQLVDPDRAASGGSASRSRRTGSIPRSTGPGATPAAGGADQTPRRPAKPETARSAKQSQE